ncbi:MAG: IclR family transcriptional regulator [Verrucomicrobiae bacterium]|nr:IclR family transcriptional regulator [Verrucomicrobiae bacterium]
MKSATPEIQLNPDSLSPGTDRTLAILEILAENPQGLSVADLVRGTGISQNSAFRITQTLHERGYLHRRESDKRYTLSNRLFDLSRPRIHEKSLSLCAHEALRDLRDGTGETVQLLVRSGAKGVVLEQVSGLHAVKVMGEVGMRVPLYSCAPGKAILAFLPDAERDEWLASVKLKKFTQTTRSTRKSLLADLAEIRERGYATDLAEGLAGIHCVGAPVFNAYEYPVAAVTVMAPVFRLPPEQFSELGERCRVAADQIRERLLA